ncbi:MAG: RNA polymerase factor sigma-54 [Muribaculaceae bacterium]|nr:RNA polymerase factor sigma-54 [Muribaculaceae bacterium]
MAGQGTGQIQVQQQEKDPIRALNRIVGELLDGNEEDALKYVQNEVERNMGLEQKNSGDPEAEHKDTQTEHNDKRDDSYDYGIPLATGGSRGGSGYVWGSNDSETDETIIEHMMPQINESSLNEKQRLIATYIVGNLDNWGYLTRKTDEIADDMSFNDAIITETSEVEEVLKVVQDMEPAGIAARDIPECLLLQLKQRNTPYTKDAIEIVTKHFKDLANNRHDRIAASMGITVEDVSTIITKEIHKLDPKPGAAYAGTSARPISPTFYIMVEGNDVRLEIPNKIPDLYVSKSYAAELARLNNKDKLSANETKEKSALQDSVNKANLLIKALQMRQETLTQTMMAIIDMQREYFLNDGDDEFLVPMTLKDLQEKTGRDQSVLSRATSNKYASTPWGTIALRDLFSEGIEYTDSDGNKHIVSTTVVKNRLRNIISEEDKQHPLSDMKLCEALNEMGFNIARRTVAKYREEMKINPAKVRKEHFKTND